MHVLEVEVTVFEDKIVNYFVQPWTEIVANWSDGIVLCYRTNFCLTDNEWTVFRIKPL